MPQWHSSGPDASLLRLERWQALTGEQRRGVSALRRKMAGYQANGARLGWLLLPEERAVEIWPASPPGRPSSR